jgi:hypothetical protein
MDEGVCTKNNQRGGVLRGNHERARRFTKNNLWSELMI